MIWTKVCLVFLTLISLSFTRPQNKDLFNDFYAKIFARDSSPSKPQVCTSDNCKKVADKIRNAINKTGDPCVDFYNYACGNWIATHSIPKGLSQYSTITELSNNNQNSLKEALENSSPTDSVNIKKVKDFYRSCMDIETQDKLGNKPVLDFLHSIGGWKLQPKGDHTWSEKKWNFYDTIDKMHRDFPAELFFTLDVTPDPTKHGNETKTYTILIDQASLNLPQILYFTSNKILKLLWAYMVTIANLTGASLDTAKEEMKEVLKFEGRLAAISVPKIAKRYARVTVKKLADAVPSFPWVKHLQNVFKPAAIKETDKVIVLANNYIPEMIDLIRKTKKSVLSNYMAWRMIKDVIPMADKEYRHVYFQFKKTLLGIKTEKPRWKTCYSYTNNILGPLLGALFIRNNFSPDSKNKVEEMMDGIIKAFEWNVQNVGWVSKETIDTVLDKADAAVVKVGYPEYLHDEKVFYNRYKELEINPGQWFNNIINADRFSNWQTYTKLNSPVDRHQWITVPHLVNAFYVITKNEVVVPAGILQPPFFYANEIPQSISYGAIGHVLGHELTHGFDTTGRDFDKFGERLKQHNNHSKWSTDSVNRFKNRTTCLVKQFNEFKVLGKFHCDGKKTLGENIADLGGVKLAFKAYEEWKKKHGTESLLPDLDLTNEELFFIGYAQKECTNTSKLAEFLAVTEDVHALSKFRVTGAMRNFPPFSEVFKCKLGTPMNPKEKCEVW